MGVAAVHEVAALDEAGASAVEYCLMLAGIAAVVIVLVFVLGGFVKQTFQGPCDTINEASTIAASATCTSP